MANTNEKKLTKVDALNVALTALEGYSHPKHDEIVEKIQGMIAQLQKKNSATSGKKSPKQIANDAIKAQVVAFMAEGETYTISDLLKHVPDLPEDTNNQKMTSLMHQLIAGENPQVVRTEGKGGKALFGLNPDYVPADEDEEEEG